jgi:hypothetical protein
VRRFNWPKARRINVQCGKPMLVATLRRFFRAHMLAPPPAATITRTSALERMVGRVAGDICRDNPWKTVADDTVVRQLTR